MLGDLHSVASDFGETIFKWLLATEQLNDLRLLFGERICQIYNYIIC